MIYGKRRMSRRDYNSLCERLDVLRSKVVRRKRFTADFGEIYKMPMATDNIQDCDNILLAIDTLKNLHSYF